MQAHDPRRNDQVRKTARQRGYDRAWQVLRVQHLAAHPLCVLCGGPGVDVDHRESVRAAPHRRLDPLNLMTLCHRHHSILTQAHDAGGSINPNAPVQASGQVDEAGRQLDPSHPWYDGPTDALARRGARARMKAAAIKGNRT